LTRPAPADENAGSGTPSPQGRGLFIHIFKGEGYLFTSSRERAVYSHLQGSGIVTLRLANGSDPSPVPLRLMKTPAAGHPLPKGEGCLFTSSRERVIYSHLQGRGLFIHIFKGAGL